MCGQTRTAEPPSTKSCCLLFGSLPTLKPLLLNNARTPELLYNPFRRPHPCICEFRVYLSVQSVKNVDSAEKHWEYNGCYGKDRFIRTLLNKGPNIDARKMPRRWSHTHLAGRPHVDAQLGDPPPPPRISYTCIGTEIRRRVVPWYGASQ